MENAIARVLKKDLEAQEKLKVSDSFNELYEKRIKEKSEKIKKEIWDKAYQHVESRKKELNDELSGGEKINTAQSDELKKQLEKDFEAGKSKWTEELFERVVSLKKSDL